MDLYERSLIATANQLRGVRRSSLTAKVDGGPAKPARRGTPMPEQIMQNLPIFAFMIIVLVMFYFMIIRPTKQRQSAHQNLVGGLKEGDEIVTAGGVYGKITKVRDKTVDIEVAPNVRLKFDRRAIRRRAHEEE
jgi:preprotein translocase subunit YajC